VAVAPGRQSGGPGLGAAVPGSLAGRGLTDAEAASRSGAGEANDAVTGSTRSYATILRTNVLSFYNMILFVIGIALLSMGRSSDAFVTVGIGVVNAVVSGVQEIRAKRQLDRLRVLDRALVLVVRDGREVEVPPEAVVRGDVLHVRPGDQIVVDGPLAQCDRMEVDESLLTGEPDPVPKHVGDDLRSGSISVAGTGFQVARDVGATSYAGRLTVQARRESTDRTPLQRQIEFLVRLVMAVTVLMSGTILAQVLIDGLTLLRIVQITAVLSGLVPYGLFLLVAVACTTGAVTISRRGALVQQVNAVESLCSVDVVCTDKTGTLTTGQLIFAGVEAVGGVEQADAEAALGALVHSATTTNLTTAALAAALPGATWIVRDEVAFTSARRWSGVATDDAVWVLGAPDRLAPRLAATIPEAMVTGPARRGLRVLLLARSTDPAAQLHDADGRAALPDLQPVAVVTLADELRADTAETITRFHEQGVALKVLSGDDPRTVAALVTRAGIESATPASGHDLDGLPDGELDELVAGTTVFGRLTPEQKERIVVSLRRQGHYVAMIGDGVNDASALKSAQVGIAMRSGSPVTRDVADIVLVDDSFAALIPAQREGRRIVNGIAVSLYVYLVRVATQGLVIVAVTMLGLGFPYSPTQLGLTLLTVGVPTLFLTFWARPVATDQRLLGSLARFVIPTSVVTAAFGTAIYAYLYRAFADGLSQGHTPAHVVSEFERYTGLTYTDSDFATASSTIGAQTGLTTFVCLTSFLSILFLAPPNRFFAAWTSPAGDRRPAALVAILLAALAAVMYVPALSDYFGLTGPTPRMVATVLPAVGLWYLTLSLTFHYRLMDRALGLDALRGSGPGSRTPDHLDTHGSRSG